MSSDQLRNAVISDAQEYLNDALEFERRMLDSFERGDWKAACFNAHQSSQLALKALLLRNLGRFKHVHSLDQLLREYASHGGKIPRGLVQRARRLNIHYIAPRYFEIRRRLKLEYTRQTASRALRIAQEIITFVRGEWSAKLGNS